MLPVSLALNAQGRFGDVRRWNDEVGPLAERVGNTGGIMQHRRTTTLADFYASGDLDLLDALGTADRDLCESAGFRWVSSSWTWLGLARFLRGDWVEALPLFEEAARLEPPGTLSGWNASLLFECLAYRGDKAEALAVLNDRQLPPSGQPKSWGAAVLLLVVVEGLTVLGERDRAAALYPSVVDVFERTGALCPHHDDGRLYERAAGIAALAGRRWDAAQQHFRTALRQAADFHHRPEEAHTRGWYGRMLLERASPGDRPHAEKVLRQAAADYERMGMPRHRVLAARMV
ncbi:MAG: hypothetical protein ACRD0C_03070 [Acidimicrobiia bacterium]